jgi:hypothetical protein
MVRGKYKKIISRKYIKKYPEYNLKIEDVVQIQVTTLNDVIKQYSNDEFPDFMSIDIEGLDFDVLESCDFSKGKPLVLCVELGNVIKMNNMLKKRFCSIL